MVNPELQLAHIAAPFTTQAAPILGVPFGQLQTFEAQRVCCALMVNPELQRAHILAPFTVQAVPVLGVPLGQVHWLLPTGACELPPVLPPCPMLRLQLFKPYVKK